MNLRQIIDMAGSILDYSPDVQSYRDEIRRYVNEAYVELFSSHEWTFSQRTRLVTLNPDLSLADLSIVLPVGHRTVQLQDPLTRNIIPGWVNNAIVEVTAQTGTVAIPQELVVRTWVDGNTVVLEDRNGGDLGAAFGTATAVTVRFKQRYVDLPQDCVDVLSVNVRYPDGDRASFPPLERWIDEDYNLDIDRTGRPENYIVVDDVFVDAPVLTPICSNVGAGVSPVPVAGDWDVVYTHVKGGRESAPSRQSTLTTFSVGDRMAVAGLQDNGPDNDTGYRKRVYARGPSSAAFFQVGGGDVLESVTFIPAPVLIDASYLKTARRLPGHGGHYKRIRMYPRQSSLLQATVRYMARAPQLLDDSDSPGFAPAHHRYLVYAACAELFVKHGSAPQAELYRGKAALELSKMTQRYLADKGQMLIKGGFNAGRRYSKPWVTLSHTP
jgi:hypothetical protein